jgi:hypothetical protein
MIEIKAYKQTSQIYEISRTYIPSGFKGVWIEVAEDPTYTLSVRYLHSIEIEDLKLEEV